MRFLSKFSVFKNTFARTVHSGTWHLGIAPSITQPAAPHIKGSGLPIASRLQPKMGQLVDGVWSKENVPGGTSVTNWLTPDGSPGPEGQQAFPAEKGRYYLYVSLGCPFANRSLIAHKLKGLEGLVPIAVVSPVFTEYGFDFDTKIPGTTGDPLYGAKRLSELYVKSDPKYSGRVTVPLLWDSKTGKIVNNESSDIDRIFYTAFDKIGAKPGDYYPEDKRKKIDEVFKSFESGLLAKIYAINSAKTQEAYDTAANAVFDALDKLDDLLAKQRFTVGNEFTEADVKLFVVLIRFDPVFYILQRLDKKRISDYKNIGGYVRDIVQTYNLQSTVNVQHNVLLPYSKPELNPSGIIPLIPYQDLETPANRDHFK